MTASGCRTDDTAHSFWWNPNTRVELMRGLMSMLILAVATACTLQKVPSFEAAPMDDHTAHMDPADRVAPARAAMAPGVQGTPGLPASNNAAPARLQASPRHGEWVKIAWTPGSSDSLMAWVVYPMSSAKAPVVVVVHEIFGLSTWVRGVADQLAADGFIAIAPDFLSRVRGGPSNVELPSQEATQLIRGVDAAERNRAIVAAANYAMMLPAAEQQYAVIGYCWGGTTTFMHAVHGGVRGFSAGVAYYGMPYTTGGTPATATSPAVPSVPDSDSLARIQVPVMLLNGSRDARIAAAMPAIDSIMKARGKAYEGVNYEGAVHGFLRAQDDQQSGRNQGTEAANLAAAKAAWPKTVAFLKQHLGVR
jgi:carboxymethylenebutenolidase